MFPFLDLKIIKIPMYGLCILVGIVIASILAVVFIKRDKKNIWDFIIMGACTFGFAFFGAKLLYILVSYPSSLWGSIILGSLLGNSEYLASGFVFYGGFLGGAAGYLLGALVARCSPKTYLDYVAFMVPLAHCFGRIACTCAGCCYGIPYEGPFALHYTSPLSTAPVDAGCFPVQLMEAFLNMVLALAIIFLLVKRKTGLIYIYLLIYPIIRFSTEFFRADAERGFLLGLSTSQFISAGIFLFAVVLLLVKLFKKNKKENDRQAV